MAFQTTFRDVAKPKLKVLTTSLAGGVLPMDKSTAFVFAADAVGTVSSLSGHEYLVDGQVVWFTNAHATNDLTLAIGTLNKVIPAGYMQGFIYDEANVTFHQPSKMADVKPLEDDIATLQSDLATETSNRINEDLTFVKLDGSRAMTGNLDMANNFLKNVPSAANSDEAINKAQFDTAIATLESSISANATALSWRKPVDVVTKFTSGNIPVNGDALVESHFGDGAGQERLFEDDAAPERFMLATFEVNKTVLFCKDGQEPKLMICRDDLGTKKWFDETEADQALRLERQIAAGDTFVVRNDLTDETDAHEKNAIFHIEDGVPKEAQKIADLDWDSADGISISPSYTQGAGGETVTAGDSVEGAIQKLDGNIVKTASDAAAALSAAIAQEVIDRDAAIASAIAQEVIDRDAAILASQNTQDAALASNANGEGASLIGIEDAGALITASTVEGALVENRALIDTNVSDIAGLQADVAQNTSDIGQNVLDIATNANNLSQLEADLASTAAGKGASKVSVEDPSARYTATTVEGALAEIDDKVNNLNLVTHERGLFEVTATGATTLNLTTDFVDVLGGGGVVQDLSAATYMNAWIVRDGATLIGGVGYTLAGNVITFEEAGGGEMVAGEVIEVRVVNVS